jgi:hypothetical protein
VSATKAPEAVAEKIVALADDYARQIVASLPVESEALLTEGISGALLSFLADVVVVVSDE